MKRRCLLLALIILVTASGCVPIQNVTTSRDILWNQFGNKSVDSLLMTWGAPQSETHLSNGARLLAYQHTTINNASSPYELSTQCEVSFLATPPHFMITNIAMRGDAFDCKQLSSGQSGITRDPYMPPPTPIYSPTIYHGYYR